MLAPLAHQSLVRAPPEGPGSARLSDPAGIGEFTLPRSTEPSRLDMPVALTSPRLSPRYRVPQYLPLTSSSKSPHRPLSGFSPRSLPLVHTITPAMKAAEPHGKHLLDATRLGNIERMRDLIANLASPADLQFRNKFGNTPLMLACQRSNFRAVQLLIVRGSQRGFTRTLDLT